MNMQDQNKTSSVYTTVYEMDLGIVPYIQNEIVGGHHSRRRHLSESRRPALFVINSHNKARQMFMRFKMYKFKSYEFECEASNIEQEMFDYMKKNYNQGDT